MAAHKPIAPSQMVAVVSVHLCRLGFWVVSRSPSGSRYLRLSGYPYTMRIADHQWSGFSKQNMRHVIMSAVLRPAPEAETWRLAVELAVRFIVKCRARMGMLGGEAVA